MRYPGTEPPSTAYYITEVCVPSALSNRLTAEISPATSLNFPAAAARGQKCAVPAVLPLCNPRRTFPDERRDCRCNGEPSLPGFSDQQANPIACRRDANQ